MSFGSEVVQPNISFPNISGLVCYADEMVLAALLAQPRSSSAMVSLAWHLRQRDSAQALGFADAADAAMVNDVDLSRTARKLLQARLQLVRAEVAMLIGQFGPAERALSRAKKLAADNSVCAGDAWLTEAMLAIEMGRITDVAQLLEHAIAVYRAAGDTLRSHLAQAWLAYLAAFTNPDAGLEIAAKILENYPNRADLPVCLSALLFCTERAATFWRDPARAVIAAQNGTKAALQVGLVRLAINSELNAGWILECLGDFEGAATLYDSAAAAAAHKSWKNLIAFAGARLGSLQSRLGQLERSRETLEGAVASMADAPGGHTKSISYSTYANTLLAQGDVGAAIAAFEIAIGICRDTQFVDNLIECLIDYARALSAAQRIKAALDTLAEAQTLIAQLNFAERGVALAQAQAEIYRRHALPAPALSAMPNATLHFLEAAMAQGKSITHWQAPTSLLQALGEHWANVGQMQRAFDYATLALHTEQNVGTKRAATRMTLMQMRRDVEQAQLQAQHHQQLAALSSETSRTLSKLGDIGQQLTAHLSSEALFTALSGHLEQLVAAEHISLWLRVDATTIERQFGLEDAAPLPPLQHRFASQADAISQCLISQIGVLLTDFGTFSALPATIRLPGVKRSFLAPLRAGERALGLLMVQTRKANAFAEREQLIFRTLSAYTAIALDNANAYEALDTARSQLEQASWTDPLTGLRNRRFMLRQMEQLEPQLHMLTEQSSAHSREYSPGHTHIFFLIDLDHFKAVNDQYGHAGGDAVLLQVRARLLQVFADDALMVRWGGEEFLVMAAASAGVHAPVLAARLNAAFSATPFVLEGGVQIKQTCSIGVACFPLDPNAPAARSWQQSIAIADYGLYQAKKNGRNTWRGLTIAPDAVSPGDLLNDASSDVSAAIAMGYLLWMQP